jgi:hypothetical protein
MISYNRTVRLIILLYPYTLIILLRCSLRGLSSFFSFRSAHFAHYYALSQKKSFFGEIDPKLTLNWPFRVQLFPNCGFLHNFIYFTL